MIEDFQTWESWPWVFIRTLTLQKLSSRLGQIYQLPRCSCNFLSCRHITLLKICGEGQNTSKIVELLLEMMRMNLFPFVPALHAQLSVIQTENFLKWLCLRIFFWCVVCDFRCSRIWRSSSLYSGTIWSEEQINK